MILTESKSVEVLSDIDNIQGGISNESLPFMFNILSKSYYGRKIDSIVRELVSNCFDANTELGTTDPVIIEKRYDVENNCYNMVFKDVGIGMSPSRMVNVFNNWFTSTKRESNKYIGAFGLGSKSPFSYTDSFYITTIHNGLKYDYVYILTSTLPDLISLNGYEYDIEEVVEDGGVIKLFAKKVPKGIFTDEHSGTEIIIPLINGTDASSFIASIRKELCYFDDVYTVGLGIPNDYSIYRKSTFLYRQNGGYSQQLHIVLGKCCYPIDWEQLDREPVDLPFGIRFEIGELQVIPNRESIVYDTTDDDTIKRLINRKIDEVLEEVNELLSKGDTVKETDDLGYYLQNRNKKPAIWFDSNPVYIPIKYVKNKNSVLQFTPLKHLPIVIPSDPFFYYRVVASIDKELYTKNDYPDNVTGITKRYIIMDSPANMYTNAYIGYGNIIKKDKLTKTVYNSFVNQLGLYKYRKRRLGEYTTSGKDGYYDYYDVDKVEHRRELVLGKHKMVLDYIRVMDEYMAKNITYYSEHTPDAEWIEEYKQNKRELSAAYNRKLNGEILIRKPNGYKETVKLLELSKVPNLIYYVYEGNNYSTNEKVVAHIDKLSNITRIATTYKRAVKKTRYRMVGGHKILIKKGMCFDKTAYWKTQYRFVGVSRSNLSTLKRLENIVCIDDIEEFPIYKKYDQIYNDWKCLLNVKYKLNNVRWWVSQQVRDDIENRLTKCTSAFMNIEEYGKHVVDSEPSKEIKLYVDTMLKQFKKLELVEYIYSSVPTKLIVPITSKLGCRLLDTKYLGANPASKYKERQFKQNILMI